MLRPPLLLLACTLLARAAAPLSVAVFQADVTPPLGTPLCHGAIEPARTIVDPLSARGLVLLGAGKPIVLVSVDWVGIANEGHDEWRQALATATGTTMDRVRVHVVHPHDTPGYDPKAERLLEARGLGGKAFNSPFAREAIARTARAAAEAVRKPQRITHVALGRAEVRQVASNRRILGPDGKVKFGRMSSCRDPQGIAAPEGLIDPWLRLVAFWDGDRPVAVLTYYATHPQSYYGKGGVSAEFVGMARSMREAALNGVPHIHFNGASGNVAAGKYNNGSPEMRPVLARRLADGMEAAWKAAEKMPLGPADVGFRTTKVTLPPIAGLDRKSSQATLDDPKASLRDRIAAARKLVWLDRGKVDLGCLALGPARIIDMPGELFVEYQLAAQRMRPNSFVAMAAYGDYGPSYIGTRDAYPQGGYEVTVSRTAPEVEDVLMAGMRTLLK
ncbi:MAG TPA: hypothetical protein VN442_20700 [Bryobacteraceae bacterium]|nr:hypothetical protein [Bryobacteraceae bacterium]